MPSYDPMASCAPIMILCVQIMTSLIQITLATNIFHNFMTTYRPIMIPSDSYYDISCHKYSMNQPFLQPSYENPRQPSIHFITSPVPTTPTANIFFNVMTSYCHLMTSRVWQITSPILMSYNDARPDSGTHFNTSMS